MDIKCRNVNPFSQGSYAGYDICSILKNQQMDHGESICSSHVNSNILLVIGVGNIGGAAGKQCTRLCMEVIVIGRHGNPVSGFSQVLTTDYFEQVLPQTDFVLMATPLTLETKNMLGRRKQSLMKSGAGVMNVGRA